jgi:hypothetical protein
MLGRRKHSRFLLSEPVDCSLRLRDEVAIEVWGEKEVVVISPEPIRPDERLTLEIPGDSRRRLSVRVSESRPAVADDGVIRHRVRLSIEDRGTHSARDGGDQP